MTIALPLRVALTAPVRSVARWLPIPTARQPWHAAALMALVVGFWTPLQAQNAAPTATGPRSVNEWLMRMHEASRQRAYMGTLVVSAGSSMSVEAGRVTALVTHEVGRVRAAAFATPEQPDNAPCFNCFFSLFLQCVFATRSVVFSFQAVSE